MKTEYFRVAGHLFSLSMPKTSPLWGKLGQYAPFKVRHLPCCRKSEIFNLTLVEDLGHIEKTILFDQDVEKGETKITLYTTSDGSLCCEASVGELLPVCSRQIISPDFKRSRLQVLVGSQDLFAINNALMLQYAFATAGLDTLEMHASVISKDDKAYLFLAKSGTGKSTQSSMWLRTIPGAWLLNDDNPIVRFIDGKAIAYGSPWSGKTPCYKNASCPVGAFVKIVRAPYNKVTPLTPIEEYIELYSSSSGFKFDKKMADSLHQTYEKLCSSVKAFALECLPNEDAARVCAVGVGVDDGASEVSLPNEMLFPEIGRLLREGKEVELRPKGSSMMPFIHGNRDSVRLKAYHGDETPEVGDIALVWVGGNQYILHRIVEVAENLITLKGDGNLRGYEHCHKSDVLGKTTMIIRESGRVLDCTGRSHRVMQKFWNAQPLFFRRVYLGLDRRIRKYITKKTIV